MPFQCVLVRGGFFPVGVMKKDGIYVIDKEWLIVVFIIDYGLSLISKV